MSVGVFFFFKMKFICMLIQWTLPFSSSDSIVWFCVFLSSDNLLDSRRDPSQWSAMQPRYGPQHSGSNYPGSSMNAMSPGSGMLPPMVPPSPSSTGRTMNPRLSPQRDKPYMSPPRVQVSAVWPLERWSTGKNNLFCFGSFSMCGWWWWRWRSTSMNHLLTNTQFSLVICAFETCFAMESGICPSTVSLCSNGGTFLAHNIYQFILIVPIFLLLHKLTLVALSTF